MKLPELNSPSNQTEPLKVDDSWEKFPFFQRTPYISEIFNLGFNTFQVVYRLKKSLDQEKYIYLQLSDDDNPENVILSAETPHAVHYFYRDFSLINDDDYIHRLNLDGSNDKVDYPDEFDDNNIFSLLRCSVIVRKADIEYGDAGDILDLDKIISFDEGHKQYSWKLNIATLPGNLGFEKINDNDSYVKYEENLEEILIYLRVPGHNKPNFDKFIKGNYSKFDDKLKDDIYLQ